MKTTKMNAVCSSHQKIQRVEGCFSPRNLLILRKIITSFFPSKATNKAIFSLDFSNCGTDSQSLLKLLSACQNHCCCLILLKMRDNGVEGEGASPVLTYQSI